ncbi:MAG: putative zinc-binding protein [Firmicutes bacterium]|nr:putative zinc-binding protein [Bacillota bacterium]
MSMNERIVLATCAGASNTGALAEAVADYLVRMEGPFEMVCLAALALDSEGAVRKTRQAPRVVVIEGCPIKCASALVQQHAGRTPDVAVQVAERYGVEKTARRDFDPALVAAIAQDIVRLCLDAAAQQEKGD